MKKKSIPYRETVYIWKGNTSKNYDTFKKSLQCLLIDKDGDIRKLTKELGLKQQTTLRKVINEGNFSHPLFYEMEKFFDVRFILGFTLWIS